jgi:hypothetical protein
VSTLEHAKRCIPRCYPRTPQASVKENTAADGIELSVEQIARLNDLTPATGERHDEANMATIDR